MSLLSLTNTFMNVSFSSTFGKRKENGAKSQI